MKLSDLKPCASCGGSLPPIWYVVRMSLAMLDQKATQDVLGLNLIFGGRSPRSLAVAEAMAPDSDAVIVAGDKDPELMNVFHLCQQCVMLGKVDLAVLMEKENT